MQARRKKAAAGCFCTHESNCYYPSLPYNPKHLIQIKLLEKEMKNAQKQGFVPAADMERISTVD